MKERPILFRPELAQAIAEGRKTVTRRPVKPQPRPGVPLGPATMAALPGDWTFANRGGISFTITNKPEGPDGWAHRNSPFGVPGDRLWVRETFWNNARSTQDASGEHSHYWGRVVEYAEQREEPGWHNNDQYGAGYMRKRPAIHMPRWASRLTLEVVIVRVERLQAISEEDAIAEGVEKNTGEGHKWSPDDGYRTYCEHYPNGCECFPHENARKAYADLWDSINGDGSWDANPWVWVVEFEVVKPETAGGS